jgi:aminoglycoside phosphotransferase (APT) family kinase protein
MQDDELLLLDTRGLSQQLSLADQGSLAQLIKRTLGAQARIADYRVLKRDRDYLVFVAQLRSPSMLVSVKLAGPGATLACPFDRTAAILHLVHLQTDIPVPEVLAVDVSYEYWPWRYMIKSYLPGREWSALREGFSNRQLKQAYQQLGRAVAELHSIGLPSFGELTADGTVESGALYLSALAERAKRRIASAHHAQLFVNLLEEKADLFADISRASLCHEDLHGHNVLFSWENEHWRLAAILDFDSAWAGHHESDLARLQLWDGMTGAGFWEAYTEGHTLLEQYGERRLIHQLMWCLEYSAATSKHLADTKRICIALGLPPIESFA